MGVDLIFKIAAIGILVAVLNLILVRSGRDEQALLTTLAGLIVVLVMLLQQISDIVSLLCRIVLSVNNLNVYAQLLSLSFNAFSQGNEERIVLGRYREADSDFLVSLFAVVTAAAANDHHSHSYDAG